MDRRDAIETLARYASAYPGTLDGIAERLEMDGNAERARHYRRAFREVQAAVEAAREALGLI